MQISTSSSGPSRKPGPSFVGREWIVASISDAVKNKAVQIALIVGSPGIGKSALLTHLADLDKGSFRFALRRDSLRSLDLSDAKSFLLGFGYHLAGIHPELFADGAAQVQVGQRIGKIAPGGEAVGAHIDRYLKSPFAPNTLSVLQKVEANAGRLVGIKVDEWVQEHRQLSVEDLLDLAVIRPLRRMRMSDPTTIVCLYIDALDEIELQGDAVRSESSSGASLLDLLTNTHELPANLKIVAASRPGRFLERLLALDHVAMIPIDEASPENLADLASFVTSTLAVLDPGASRFGNFAGRLIERARGNFLYASLVLRSLDVAITDRDAEALTSVISGDQLPEGLPALFRLLIARLESVVQARHERANWGEVLGPLLGFLAIARRALSYSEIARATGLDRLRIASVFGSLGPILDAGPKAGEPVGLFHKSLSEYLLDYETPYRVDRAMVVRNAHESVMAAWGGMSSELKCLRDGDEADLYALDHLIGHLLDIGRPDDARELLTAPRFVARRIQATGARRVIADIEAVRAANPHSTDMGVMKALGEFLHTHGTWLGENPQAFLPQLVEWYLRSGSSHEASFVRFMDSRVLPICYEDYPEGCLWTNEAQPTNSSSGRAFGVGFLNLRPHDHAVELANGLVAVAGLHGSPISIFDRNGLMQQIEMGRGFFVRALFAFDDALGIVGTMGNDYERYLVILHVDPRNGVRREAFRFRSIDRQEVIRAAAAISGGGAQVIVARQSGVVRRIVFRPHEAPKVEMKVFPGSVTAVTCVSDEALYIAICQDGNKESEDWHERALSRLTARHAIFCWFANANRIEPVFITRRSKASTIARMISLHLRGKIALMVDMGSAINAIARTGDGELCFARGCQLFKIGPRHKTATWIYDHPHPICGLATIGAELLVVGQDAAVVDPREMMRGRKNVTEVDAIAGLPDGQVMVFAHNGPKAILNPRTERQLSINLGRFGGPPISRVEVDRFGSIGILGVFDSAGVILRPSALGSGLRPFRSSSWTLAASPNGGFFSLRADGDGYRVIVIRHDGRHEDVFTLPKAALHDKQPVEIFFSDADTLVILTEHGHGTYWDVAKGVQTAEIMLENFQPWFVDGRSTSALSGGRVVGADSNGTVRVWDHQGRICTALLVGFKPRSLTASPKTNQITLCGPEGRVVSLSIRTDPRSLSLQDLGVLDRRGYKWQFPYFPAGVLHERVLLWRRQAIGYFVLFSLFGGLIGCIGGGAPPGATAFHALGFGLLATFSTLVIDLALRIVAHWKLNRTLAKTA